MNNVSLLPRRRVPPPSPERATLAERIADRNAARARLEGLHAASRRAVVWDAERARDAARAAAEQAAVTDARAATDAMIAGTAAPPATLPAARLAMTAAEDAVAAAIVARDTVNADISTLESGAELRDIRVAEAAAAVVRVEGAAAIRGLLAEIDALHKSVADKGLALAALLRHDVVKDIGPAAMPGVSELNSRMWHAPASWTIANVPHASPSAAAWDHALAALKLDAEAPLP